MKKYLLIGDGESPHLLKWAKELNKHFELYLVSSREISPELAIIIPAANSHAFKLDLAEKGGNFKFFKLIRPLRKIIKNIGPDYVNAHYITSHGVLAALAGKPSRKNYKLILSAWGSDILITPFKNPFYRFITGLALKRANLVTTDSKLVAGIVHKFTSTPTLTFPFGLEKLPDVQVEDKDPNLFFSNRTLNKNSNIDRVLEFFAAVVAKNNKARLVVANEGPLKEKLVDLSKDLGIDHAVRFMGFIKQNEQEAIYKMASFYFSILTSDALSVSLLEAMAHGCIPIVSDLPDNREWITSMKNGIIMDEHTKTEDLAGLQNTSKVIFNTNRKIVQERAIFPEEIEQFVAALINIK